MRVQATWGNILFTFKPRNFASFQVTPHARQTCMVMANSHLMGSGISSDKSFAVFSGNLLARLAAKGGYCECRVAGEDCWMRRNPCRSASI
jgi:hypothetical protein